MYNPSVKNALALGQKTAALVSKVSKNGCLFDTEKARKTARYLRRYMLRVEHIIRCQLAPVILEKTAIRSVPKKKYSNCTTGVKPSILAEQWAKLYRYTFKIIDNEWWVCDSRGRKKSLWVDLADGDIEHKDNTVAVLNLDSESDMVIIKYRLMMEHGWDPVFYNRKREESGKLAKTTPKFRENGQLCPNLHELGKRLPLIRQLILYTQLKHRLSVLETKDGTGGLLNNPTVVETNKIHQKFSGLTISRRWRHKVVVNIPAVRSPLGGKLRELFICQPHEDFITYDVISGEAFIKAHFAHPYDEGETAEAISAEGYDEPQIMGDLWFPELPKAERRVKAKRGNYALQYCCTPPTLAVHLQCSEQEAIRKHTIYWQKNRGWKAYINAATNQWRSNRCRSIQSYISGQLLQVDKQRKIGSMAAQHGLAFVMDYSLSLLDQMLGGIQTVDGEYTYLYKGHKAMIRLYVHDEVSLTADKEISAEVLELGKESIEEASRQCCLMAQMKAAGSIGRNWKETH